MGTLVLLEATAKADSVKELEEFLRSRLPETRAYDGCQGITAHRSDDDERILVMVEHWDSKDHYQRYLDWRTETGVLAELVGMLEGEPTIRTFDAVDA